MTLITKPNTYVANQPAVAAQVNANEDTIYSDYNGNITNVNISGSAAIDSSKLAQIISAAKVSGAALTLLTSIPSGAGLIPSANINTQFKLITTTYDISTASGTVTIAGAGFTPRLAIILSTVDNTQAFSIGFDDATIRYGVWNQTNASFVMGRLDTASIGIIASGGSVAGNFTSFNSDGGVIAFAKSSSPTGTAALYILFIK